MKLFKEIKRRARNVALAIAGKGAGWQEKLAPVEIKVGPPLKVETFAAEHFIGTIIDDYLDYNKVLDSYRKGLATEIGQKLLDEGVFTEEIRQRPHQLGLRGDTLRLTIRVVIPEKEAEQ